MLKKIAVVSLWAEDVHEAAHFYHDVLGMKLLDHHGDRPHFYLDGVYLTILQGRPTPAQDAVPDRFPLFAFAVDDINEIVERCVPIVLNCHGELSKTALHVG
jgi:catechol 2,3-dioxygenase-like lactoylglutathione lyase family enzyme